MDLTFKFMVLGSCSAFSPLLGFAGSPHQEHLAPNWLWCGFSRAFTYGFGKAIVLLIKRTWLKQRLMSVTDWEWRERERKVVSSLWARWVSALACRGSQSAEEVRGEQGFWLLAQQSNGCLCDHRQLVKPPCPCLVQQENWMKDKSWLDTRCCFWMEFSKEM